MRELFQTNIDKLKWFYDNTLKAGYKRSIEILIGLFKFTIEDPLSKGIFNINGAKTKKLFPNISIIEFEDEDTLKQ